MRAVVAVLLFVTAAHAALWGLFQEKQPAPDFRGILPSVSYAPFEGTGHPDVDNIPQVEKIRADLKKLSTDDAGDPPLLLDRRRRTGAADRRRVRPEGHGRRLDRQECRPQRARDRRRDHLAKRNSNVNGVVVGNETIYRGEQKVEDLIDLIKRVKKSVNVPVTTGEIWNIWRDNPELASSVDFIAAHVLPYWENFTDKQAVDQAVYLYQLLREKFPGKRIVIAEFGWPSAGYNLRNAEPGPFEQASVLRNFVTRAEAIGMEYNIVEAIDQPWKFFEGGVGPYWGILNAVARAEIRLDRPDRERELLEARAHRAAGRHPDVAADPAARPADRDAGPGAVGGRQRRRRLGRHRVRLLGRALFRVRLGLRADARPDPAGAAGADRDGADRGNRGRRLRPRPAPADHQERACCAGHDGRRRHLPESLDPHPGLFRAGRDAEADARCGVAARLSELRMRRASSTTRPIRNSGSRSRITAARSANASSSSTPRRSQGFKAGALRIAMERTAADAEIIGIIDADYVVQPDWLKDLVPVFADPRVGLVQAPQEHRDGDRSLMHYIMNGEYAGFFDIGMVQRNEYNAIIVHGTMCLIRRAAMDMAGGWAGDTICEDTDLGLAIIEQGWLTHYTNDRYGHGLLPDTYEAFKKQRHRWAYGGFQIVKKHWRRFLPGASRLSPDQRREFSLGWLNWLGAESLGVVVAILNLIWVPIVAFADIAIPDKILTLPIIASFIVSLVHFVALYRLRVQVKAGQMLGAMIAAMSVQWTVSRAVAQGLITEHLPFARTSKGGLSRMSIEFQAFWEAVIGVLLLVGATVLVVTNGSKQVREIYIFAGVLVLESLPFLSAVAIALLENSRINSFAFWRNSAVRTAELIGLRPVTPADGCQAVPAGRVRDSPGSQLTGGGPIAAPA